MTWPLRRTAAALQNNPWPVAFGVAFAAIAALHLVALGTSPPGLYVDEASIGYNAWSVAHTARDEHGHFLPFYFEAFGEYKNPVYIYALAPFTWVLPLTPYVVRLPAALFGLLTCAMLALFAHVVTRSRAVALLTLVTAGITPWLVQESRLGFEVISMVALLAVMLWCLARALEGDSWRWYAAAGAALGLSTFAYSTGRAFTLAAVLALVLSVGRLARSNRWAAALVAPLASVAAIAVYNLVHDGAITARFNAIGITADHPGPLTLVQRFAGNYVDYWNVPFLFTHGDSNLRHSTGFGGMLLVTTLPLLLAGIAVCVRRWREPLPRFLLIAAVLAPAPAALTAEGTPHSLRAATMLPFLLALMVYGWAALLPRLATRRVVAAVLGAAVLVEAGGYIGDMFTAYPGRALAAFDTGEAAAIAEAGSIAGGKHDVWISTTLEGATIEALFALHPDPPAEGADDQAALARIGVHVEDSASIGIDARAGDMLVLSGADPVPQRARVVLVDRRTTGDGSVDLVAVARQQP